MFTAMLSILFACLCWGFVFVLPSWIKGFSPLEISLGRFFIYGFVCMVWLVCSKRHLLSFQLRSLWVKSAWYGFASTLLCYTGMVFGMKYASPAISTLVYAMSPITIAIFGNLRKKEYSHKKFIFPSLLMLSGIAVANIDAFQESVSSPLLYTIGLISAFIGLASWTWYAVDNSSFMRQNRVVKPNDWSAMMGSSTFIIVLAIGALSMLFSPDLSKFFVLDSILQKYLIGCFVLGTVSTCLAFYFWNQGSKRLPISLIGLMMMLEVVFGLILIYLFERRFPLPLEALGIVLMMSGVVIGCRSLTKVDSLENEKIS